MKFPPRNTANTSKPPVVHKDPIIMPQVEKKEKKKKTLDEIYLDLVNKVSESALPEYQRLKKILTANDHNHQFQRRIILDVLQLLFFA
jgi:hypothetical protein